MKGKTQADQYLKDSYKEGGGSLFTTSLMEAISSNRPELHLERFHSDIRDFLQWHKLPRDMVEFPSLEDFKMRLQRRLDNLL